MSNEIMNQKNQLAKEEQRFTYKTQTGEELKLTKATVQKFLVGDGVKISDPEFMMFFQLCKTERLNPFIGEAYLVKYSTNSSAQLVADYKVLQKRANNNPNFKGLQSGIVVLTEKGEIVKRNGQIKLPKDKLLGGWCDVYKKDTEVITQKTISYDEFVGKKKDGSVNSMWATKPNFMCEKVAKAHALREAFPNEISNLYTKEEFSNDEPKKVAEEQVIDIIDEADVVSANDNETNEPENKILNDGEDVKEAFLNKIADFE